MVFSKRFPKPTEGSVYPKWVEMALTAEEEKDAERHTRGEHIELFKQCISDAEKIVIERNLKGCQSDIISIAAALFEKRASHVVYHKENKAKDKFDKSN